MSKYYRAIVAGFLYLVFAQVGLFTSVMEAAAEGPTLIWQGVLSNEFELLLDAQGRPHILWKNSTDARPFDEKVHLASLSSTGWEVLSTSLVSGEEPIGAYDQQGTLYLVIRNISPLNTLSLLTLPEELSTPQAVAKFQWSDFLVPIFLSPPMGDHPLSLIFDSAEWRWTPLGLGCLDGHCKRAYSKYFFTQWDGQHWSPPVQIVDRGRFHGTATACGVGTLSLMACAWTDSRYGWEKNALFFAEYDGAKWSKNIELGEGKRASLGMEMTIAIEPGGNITVAFLPTDAKGPKGDQFESAGILVQQRRGQTWGKVQQLSAASSRIAFSRSSYAEAPQLSIDLKNHVHLIWQEGSRIMHRMQLGEQWTPPAVLIDAGRNIRYLTTPRFSPDGQLHLTWSEWAGVESQIWYQSLRLE